MTKSFFCTTFFAVVFLVVLTSSAQPGSSRLRARGDTALTLMLSGIGPNELASLGFTAESAELLLNSVHNASALLSDIESRRQAVCDLDREIHACKATLREAPSDPEEVRGTLENAMRLRSEAAERLTDAYNELRGIVSQSAPSNSPVFERVTCSLSSSRRIPAPWRANANTPERKLLIGEAISAHNDAASSNQAVPPSMAIVLSEEQSRPETAAALSRHASNCDAIEAVFSRWLIARD